MEHGPETVPEPPKPKKPPKRKPKAQTPQKPAKAEKVPEPKIEAIPIEDPLQDMDLISIDKDSIMS